MKTIQKRWLPLFLLAAVMFLFPACEGNNPDEDLVGVVTLKMKSGSNEGSRFDTGGATSISVAQWLRLIINNANNFKIIGDGNGIAGYASGDIVDMGKKTLSKINTLPSIGWTEETAVLSKHGYIVRGKGPDDSDYKYIKVYVKDFITNTYGGIIGAEVQYCEWTPEQ